MLLHPTGGCTARFASGQIDFCRFRTGGVRCAEWTGTPPFLSKASYTKAISASRPPLMEEVQALMTNLSLISLASNTLYFYKNPD